MSIVSKLVAAFAILFGLLTLKSGGTTLFIDGAARAAAGSYVGFVLWFNFLAGFAYIIAGVFLFLGKGCVVRLSMVIAILTLLVFAAFGVHIMTGGEYEQRTLGAMVLRSGVWVAIALYVRAVWKKRKG